MPLIGWFILAVVVLKAALYGFMVYVVVKDPRGVWK